MSSAAQQIKIAYFVNQYPGISHSFIRREIQALERQDVEVLRYAIRPSADNVIAPEDIKEFEKTEHIVRQSKLALLATMVSQAARTPLATLKTLGMALKLGHCSEAGLFRHFLYFGEALVLVSWMKREGVRHVHAHFGTNASIIAMLASEFGDIQFSMTVHGPEEFEKPAQISLREKLERSAFTVAISKFGASQLKKISSPAHWSKIKIVHCGIEPDFYADQTVSLPAEKHMVCVGRLCAEKGQIDLVNALARAIKQIPDLSLSLIGDGPMRPDIEAAISAHNLADRIVLEGWKTPDEVTAAIAKARIFILPSYAEGLPVSIMEALTLRRPVISTYVAGIPELVRPDRNGWLVPAGDVAAIEATIVEAMHASDETITKMGEAGFVDVSAEHDINTEGAKLVKHFTASLGETA